MWCSSIIIDFMCHECIFGAKSFGEATRLTSDIVSKSVSAQNAIQYKETYCKKMNYEYVNYRGPIRYACKKGDLSMVKWLFHTVPIDVDLDVYAFEYTDSALEIACEYGYKNIAEYLLLNFMWTREELGETFLSACISNNLELVQWLHDQFQFHRGDETIVESAFNFACEYSLNDQIVQWLYQTFDYTDLELETAFKRGLWNKSLNVVKMIYSICCDRTNDFLHISSELHFDVLYHSKFEKFFWIIDHFGIPEREIHLFYHLISFNRLEQAKFLYSRFQFTQNEARSYYYLILTTVCQNGALEELKWLVSIFQLSSDDIHGEKSMALKNAIVSNQIACADWIVRNFGSGFLSMNQGILRCSSVAMLKWSYKNLPGTLKEKPLLKLCKRKNISVKVLKWIEKTFGNSSFEPQDIVEAFYQSYQLDILKFLYYLPRVHSLSLNVKEFKFVSFFNVKVWKWLDYHFDLSPLREIRYLCEDRENKVKDWLQNRFQFTRDEILGSMILYKHPFTIFSIQWFVQTYHLEKDDIFVLGNWRSYNNVSLFSKAIFQSCLPVIKWLFKYFRLDLDIEKTKDHIKRCFSTNQNSIDLIPELRTQRWIHKVFGPIF